MIHRYLSNGMEVYLERNDFAPLVSLQTWVKVGSIDEDDTEAGISHVLEHMLFKGTRKRPEPGGIAAEVERAGGDMNAYTSLDRTVYYLTAPASFTERGADLLLDIVHDSLIDADELGRELEVVVEEIRRGRDNPSHVVSHALFGEIFKGHRMGRPVIGFEDVVKGFTREKVHGFYKRWYCPNNMAFVAVGAFDPEELFARLDALAQAFEPRSVPARVRPELPAFSKLHDAPAVRLARGAYQEVRLQLAVHGPVLEHHDTASWEMLASVLGHGDSSRLALTVRDELQLATSIDCGVYTPHYPRGFFSVGLYARSQTALEALKAALGELSTLAHTGPSHEEMVRVLNAVKAERIYGRESMEGIARTVASSLQTSLKLAFEDEFLARLSRVSASELKARAKDLLGRIAAGEFAISGALARDALPECTQESIAAAVQECARTLAQNQGRDHDREHDKETVGAAPQGLAPASRTISESNPSVFQLAFALPGDRALNVNARLESRLPVSSAMFVWDNGIALEPPGKNGVSALLAQMLTRGTRRQGYKSFVSELEDMSASIAAFSARDTFGIRMDALSEHAPRVLDMLLDCLFRPAFDPEEFERVHNETRDVLVAQKDSPGARLSRLSGPMLFGDHPYARSSMGTLESIAGITLEDVKEHGRRVLSNARYVFSLAGKNPIERFASRVAQECATEFAHLASPAAGAGAPAAPRSSDVRVAFDEFEREQAHITLSFRALPLTDPRRTALELAANILAGQGGRLFMDLRDRRSLAYSVSASQSPSLQAGVFSTYIGTAAHKVEEAITGLKSHLERMACEPPTQEELERAQNSVLGAQAIDAQHFHYQASQLAMSDVYGLGFDNFLRFSERVARVTPETIRALMAELLAAHPPVLSIVGPKGTFVPDADSGYLRWNL